MQLWLSLQKPFQVDTGKVSRMIIVLQREGTAMIEAEQMQSTRGTEKRDGNDRSRANAEHQRH